MNNKKHPQSRNTATRGPKLLKHVLRLYIYLDIRFLQSWSIQIMHLFNEEDYIFNGNQVTRMKMYM